MYLGHSTIYLYKKFHLCIEGGSIVFINPWNGPKIDVKNGYKLGQDKDISGCGILVNNNDAKVKLLAL